MMETMVEEKTPYEKDVSASLPVNTALTTALAKPMAKMFATVASSRFRVSLHTVYMNDPGYVQPAQHLKQPLQVQKAIAICPRNSQHHMPRSGKQKDSGRRR